MQTACGLGIRGIARATRPATGDTPAHFIGTSRATLSCCYTTETWTNLRGTGSRNEFQCFEVKRRCAFALIARGGLRGSVRLIPQHFLFESRKFFGSLSVNAAHGVARVYVVALARSVRFGSQSARHFPSFRHAEAPCANLPSNRETVASLRHGEEARDDSVAATNSLERLMRSTRCWFAVLMIWIFVMCGCGGGSSSSKTQPPAGLAYTTATAVYQVGTAITTNSPSSTGGAVSSYSVNPALPLGLAISSSTGAISGTPTQVSSAKNYVVTATNSAGSANATLSITVNAAAPASLTYSTNPAVYNVGAQITANTPTITGGAGTSYLATPSLPWGLTLDTTTGVISGTPTVPPAQANYKPHPLEGHDAQPAVSSVALPQEQTCSRR
jgi:hypothetical protein